MKKLFALLLSATMALGMLASCGSPQNNTPSESSGTSTPAVSDGSLKLVLSTADGSSTDDKASDPLVQS